jgi:U3 small nucleolar RNA-associated protein 21
LNLLQVSISFESPFVPSCLCHPDTYLNKVVVGGADGCMQLWNFVTAQLVHAFKGW